MIGFVFLFCLLFRWGILHRVLQVLGWCLVLYSSGFLCVSSIWYSLVLVLWWSSVLSHSKVSGLDLFMKSHCGESISSHVLRPLDDLLLQQHHLPAGPEETSSCQHELDTIQSQSWNPRRSWDSASISSNSPSSCLKAQSGSRDSPLSVPQTKVSEVASIGFDSPSVCLEAQTISRDSAPNVPQAKAPAGPEETQE